MATDTQQFASTLLSTMRDRMDEMMAALVAAPDASADSQQPISEADVRQILDGFVTVIDEALHQREPETRQLYMNVIYPALVRQGVTPQMLLTSSTNLFVHSGAFIAQVLPEPLRQGAISWLASFYGEYIAELATVTFAAQGAKQA